MVGADPITRGTRPAGVASTPTKPVSFGSIQRAPQLQTALRWNSFLNMVSKVRKERLRE